MVTVAVTVAVTVTVDGRIRWEQRRSVWILDFFPNRLVCARLYVVFLLLCMLTDIKREVLVPQWPNAWSYGQVDAIVKAWLRDMHTTRKKQAAEVGGSLNASCTKTAKGLSLATFHRRRTCPKPYTHPGSVLS